MFGQYIIAREEAVFSEYAYDRLRYIFAATPLFKKDRLIAAEGNSAHRVRIGERKKSERKKGRVTRSFFQKDLKRVSVN